MGRSHARSGLIQMVWVLYLGLTVHTGAVGNDSDTNLGLTVHTGAVDNNSDTNYTNTLFKTEINNVYKTYSKDRSDHRILESQEIIATGNATELSPTDPTKDTETFFRSSESTESRLQNQYRTNVQSSQSTSVYVPRGETMVSATPLPQTREIIEEEASCSHKCGQIQPFPCSCDLKCLIHQNCCEDISVVCPEILHESQISYGHMLGMKVECSNENIFLITECDPKTIRDTHKDKSATTVFQLTKDYETDLKSVMDVINNAYVTDSTTGFVYRNWDVFSCAALDNSRPLRWSVIFQAQMLVMNEHFKSVYAAMSPVQRPRLEPPTKLGANVTAAPCIQNTIGACSDDRIQMNAGIVSRCQQFVSYVSVGEVVYRNKYCVLCRGITPEHQISSVLVSNPNRNDFDFSLTMSLSGSSLNVVVKIKAAVFVENECAISTETQTNIVNVETVCSTENCNIFSVRRPDGECKRVYEMIIAVADDGFPFTADEYESFPEFLYCFIKSDIPELDIDDNFYPTVPLFDNTLNVTLYITRMFLFQLSSVENLVALVPSNLYSKLSIFSQQHKSYRKITAELDDTLKIRQNNSQLNQISINLMRNTYGKNLSKESYQQNGFGNLTTTCYCTRQLDTRVDYFHKSCDLECFQTEDVDDQDILSTTKLTSQCRSLSGGQSGTAGSVSVYLSMVYFCLTIIVVNLSI